jgi:putative transcriptional regulator
MAKKTKFKTDACEAIHTSAAALLKVGAIDEATMRDFGISYLISVNMDPDLQTPSCRRRPASTT